MQPRQHSRFDDAVKKQNTRAPYLTAGGLVVKYRLLGRACPGHSLELDESCEAILYSIIVQIHFTHKSRLVTASPTTSSLDDVPEEKQTLGHTG
ncbi:MAG: hypothetical protein U9R15_07305, partial [Chloroflexota bacterium]|nr:hypothetical protein [Chloroflexota bacterium]